MITGALQKTFNTTLDGVIPICSCQRLIINLKRHTLISVIGTQKSCFFSFCLWIPFFFFRFCLFKFFKKFLDPFYLLRKFHFQESNKYESKRNQCIKCILRRFGCLTYLLRVNRKGFNTIEDLTLRNQIKLVVNCIF